MASHFLKLFLHIGQFEVSMFSSFSAWVRQNKFRNWYNVDNRSYFLLKSRLPPKKEFETENMIRLCIETIQKPEALWVLGAFFCFFCHSEDLLSGFVAGCAAATANNPFDVIKTRQQAGQVPLYLGMEFSLYWTFQELDHFNLILTDFIFF